MFPKLTVVWGLTIPESTVSNSLDAMTSESETQAIHESTKAYCNPRTEVIITGAVEHELSLFHL